MGCLHTPKQVNHIFERAKCSEDSNQSLPSFELHLYDLVAYLLPEAHINAFGLFTELKSTLIQECLNVLKLRVVVIFVLYFFLKGFA